LGEVGADGFREDADLICGETVKEEVGDDEVVSAERCERESVGLVDADAVDGVYGSSAGSEKVEHGGALVDDVGMERGVDGEEVGKEATISVAEDESAAGRVELGNTVEAASFEHGAEGQIFEPAIGARDAVEVGGLVEALASGWHQRRMRSSSGVSRAASAAMRR